MYRDHRGADGQRLGINTMASSKEELGFVYCLYMTCITIVNRHINNIY